MHLFHIYAQQQGYPLCLSLSLTHTHIHSCLPMLGHSGSVGGKLPSDWDISGCGGSGRLIREMKLDWEEGWGERTRKDKTEWGCEGQKKRSKKKRENDKPLSCKDEQTDSRGSGCGVNLCCRWSGGRRVSYSWVQTEHVQQNKVTPEQTEKKQKTGSVCLKQTGSYDVSQHLKVKMCTPFYKCPRLEGYLAFPSASISVH